MMSINALVPNRTQFERLRPSRILKGILRRLGFPVGDRLPKGISWSRPVDVLVVCPSYPSESYPYGGQFIQSRVAAYQKSGLSVVVIVCRPETHLSIIEESEGIDIWRTNPAGLTKYIQSGLCTRVVLHHPERESWQVVKQTANQTSPLIIFHGYEARSWRVLQSSYTSDDIGKLSEALDERDELRRQTVSEIFQHPDVTPIFVSKFLKRVAEEFCGVAPPKQACVIHNPVLAEEFPYREKTPDARYSVLWMRSFQSYNYANDLSCAVILKLSERPDFEKFRFTICGDGALWENITKQLEHLDNVEFRKGFFRRTDVSKLHERHGVMLVPSRWESQGLTLCESMSSGLVPLTTAVAAVPEFVSSKEGCVCAPEDVEELVNALADLVDYPETFITLSKQAAVRSQTQCGWEKTVALEIENLKM